MTDNNDGSLSQNGASADASLQTTGTSSTSTTPQIAAVEEKLVPQSQVDKIVGSVRNEAYDKAKRDLDAENKTSVEKVSQPQRTDDEIRVLINEEADKKANQKLADKTAMEFVGKMESGSKNYSDFEAVVAPIGIGNVEMTPIVALANSVDNTADVMYELGKNPHKIGSLLGLAHANYNLALKDMQKLSNSIKQNKNGGTTATIPEPLSQVTPTLTGTDNGSKAKTIADLRKEPWLRG